MHVKCHNTGTATRKRRCWRNWAGIRTAALTEGNIEISGILRDIGNLQHRSLIAGYGMNKMFAPGCAQGGGELPLLGTVRHRRRNQQPQSDLIKCC